jgi:hypothetical protein
MKPASLSENILYLNRKFHIYIGLFLLLFIWLFSFSGLILNHANWKFTNFWDKRKESEIMIPVNMPATPDSSSLILNFMDQLNLSGEISNVKVTPTSIDFRVTKPGVIRDNHIDFLNKVCNQKMIVYNFWGKIRALHTLNGINRTNPEIQSDRIVTLIWRQSMNLIAIGLIILCVSSWLMWYEVRKSYAKGGYVLFLAFTCALSFIILFRFL